jgi:N-acyl-D-amino-acid deacylase
MNRVEAIPYASMKAGLPWDWVTFPQFLESLERQPKAAVLVYAPGPFSVRAPCLIDDDLLGARA